MVRGSSMPISRVEVARARSAAINRVIPARIARTPDGPYFDRSALKLVRTTLSTFNRRSLPRTHRRARETGLALRAGGRLPVAYRPRCNRRAVVNNIHPGNAIGRAIHGGWAPARGPLLLRKSPGRTLMRPAL